MVNPPLLFSIQMEHLVSAKKENVKMVCYQALIHMLTARLMRQKRAYIMAKRLLLVARLLALNHLPFLLEPNVNQKFEYVKMETF